MTDVTEPAAQVVRYLRRCRGSEGSEIGVRRGAAVAPLPEIASIGDLLGRSSSDMRDLLDGVSSEPTLDTASLKLLPPLDGRGEVWCAGVTYARSRGARVEESQESSIYDLVYVAERPELFLKAPAWRTVTDGDHVGIRVDSGHDVPEPELALVANSRGEIVGYTVCNDMSSRSLEGENPLYLPQAKVFAGSCALASGITPAWLVPEPTACDISMTIHRNDTAGRRCVFEESTSTDQIVRSLEGIVDALFTANDFPDGVVVATGTGIVPEMDFTLHAGDEISIAIEHVGSLSNTVTTGKQPFSWLNEPEPALPARPNRATPDQKG